MNNIDLIKNAKENALAGRLLDRENIMSLLAIAPESKECEVLGKAARDVASVICKDKAYLWGAIGIDIRSCPMNCDYCSLGEKWNLIKGESELAENEVIYLVKKYVDQGVRWIVLRTTQFYNLDKLIRMASKIKKTVVGEYELGLNVGEFDENIAERMVDAGINFAYHTLRLREGIDTRFDPMERLATLAAINNSPLKLVSLIEPLGVEHTNEEIADSLLTAMKYGAVVTGCMQRVPVVGTPLGELPEISVKRLSQVIAVTRLAAGYHAPNICVHRPSKLAFGYGANVAVIETGAIPRDVQHTQLDWKSFNPVTAKEWFKSNGYEVQHKE